MGIIKTALEIALEKTETVKSDKVGVRQFDARQSGKKIANAFLAGDADLNEEIKKASDGENACLKESIKKGIFDVLIAQISLPSHKEEITKIEKIGKGFSVIIKNKDFLAMYNQLIQIFSQYLDEISGYEKLLRQQYAPKLKQKEEELARRIGREIRIDPLQDPEFIAFYNQHMNALKANYAPVIEQAKEELNNMFEEKS